MVEYMVADSLLTMYVRDMLSQVCMTRTQTLRHDVLQLLHQNKVNSLLHT